MKHSYIVIDLKTNKAICELFSKKLADRINTNKYKVMTAYDYLCGLNSKN